MKPVTISEAAKIKGVSRQAINAAIKAKKLRVVMVDVPTRMVVRQSLNYWQPNHNMKRAGRPRNGGKSRG